MILDVRYFLSTLVYWQGTHSLACMGRKAPTKLHSHWRGPYQVVGMEQDKYTLLDLVMDKQFTVHVSTLTKFVFDPQRMNPEEIARRDANCAVVEQILEHTAGGNSKSNMDFKVRWRGYSEEHDSWLPWRELRANTVLHQYLRDHNMTTLIPKEFI